MFNYIKLRLSLGILCFIASSSLIAKESIAISAINYPPLIYLNKTEPLGYGVGRDIVDAAFRSMSTTTEYTFMPLVRNVQSVMEKKSRANLGMIEWFNKKGKGDQVKAVELLNLYFTFFYLKSRFPNEIQDLAISDMKDYSFGGIRGSTSDKILQSHGITIQPSNSIHNSFEKLNAKRIDFAVALDITGWQLIEENFSEDADTFAMMERPIFQSTLSLIFHNDDALLRKQFQQGMHKIIDSGEYQRILLRYYNNHVTNAKLMPAAIYQRIINSLQ